jgi:hypothetical protein
MIIRRVRGRGGDPPEGLPDGVAGAVEPRSPLWLERLPRQPWISVAATLLGLAFLSVALLSVRHGWTATTVAELSLASLALALMLLSPLPSASLVPAGTVVAVDLFAEDVFTGAPAALAAALLAGLYAASYLRLAIRRRDTELAVAAEAIDELTRRDRIERRLTRIAERSWVHAELDRARRHDYPLSYALVRPDDADGDPDLLEALAAEIAGEIRSSDVALRQDESVFAIVLPYTVADAARIAAERVRLGAFPGRTTVSIGLASYPYDGSEPDELVRAAERALARAVARGGNRTVCASVSERLPRGWSLAAPRS